MWFSKFTFFDKQAGLTESVSEDFFSKPFSQEEFGNFPDIQSLYPNGKKAEYFPIPKQLRLPEEYVELLQHSNGGGIINGEREFGFFSLEEIRQRYINYGFPIWAPAFLPIAFNGGGKFYAYDLRKDNEFPIILVPAGNLGYDDDCWVFLGNTLVEVLSKTTNVEDELDVLYPEKELAEKDSKSRKLYLELKDLEEKKVNGKVDLKNYLLTKKRIEAELRKL
ncbi:SMI1/KNR4 family protein [Flavobacterium quisquiliarum]|uniref:SMI1/KNR4 family protein n=1 Tax=Flavobacterium quisquiliarum TaxID=1834436 RepID=A0ABV8W276_9FLAO|nr:SMI1/KNR4 family protein [Flavobacterium quisquiliarum]MBW1655444.1 SMI1/KNR4 family protein [Flavobacterium quisquiliarum]NWL03068.1 SMI1/KNR4 family protein [Flavobacterium collinsii]